MAENIIKQNLSLQEAGENEKEEKKSSMFAAFVRDMIARMTADRLIGPKIQNGEIRKNLVEPPWKCPACFHQTQIDLPRCRAELLSLVQNPNLNRVILQLHGGGYIGAMRNKYRSFAGLYNEIGGGVNVFTPDYRVAPEAPYPAALEDAVDAWNWLLKRFRRGRACPCFVPLFKRPWDGTAGRAYFNVSVDRPYRKRGVLRDELYERPAIWQYKGKHDL